MNHELDFDRDHDTEDALAQEAVKQLLEQSYNRESEMMRSYLVTAERIHDNAELADRLREFAQGNAKRSRQLQDELSKL